MKKFTSIIISVIMILNTFCALGITASADSYTADGDYKYYISNNTATITRYYGSSTDLEIPSSVDGYIVTSIGSNAFYRCTNLKKITIPNSVTYIGDGAFYECYNLKNAIVPADVNVKDAFPSQTTIRYTEIKFTINYDANGGSDAPQEQTLTAQSREATFTVNKIPFRKGYSFVGWSEQPNGSADYLPDKTYTIRKSLTLYAIWKTANTYTINFELCGGQGDIPSQLKAEGNDLILSNIKPTHSKYTFAYWISSDKETTYSAGATYKKDADDTLYAVWKETCSKCHGSPYSSKKCDKCNGTNYSSIKTCAKCKGNGKITLTYECNSCNGTGTQSKSTVEICPLCKGKGYREKNGNYEWCYLCNAKGEVTRTTEVKCITCGGDGKRENYISCSLCEGKGEIKTLCDKCEGSGIIKTVCDKCKGKDSIIYHYPNDKYESITTESSESNVTELSTTKDTINPTVETTTKPTYINPTVEPSTKPYIIEPTEEYPTIAPTTTPTNPVKSPTQPTKSTEPTSVDEWVIIKAPTCEESVVELNKQTQLIPYIQAPCHQTKIVGKKAATYFAKGYTGDKKCTICGKVISKGKAIAKLKLVTPKVKITAGNQKLTVKYTKVKNATGFQVRYIFKGKTVNKKFTTKKSVTKVIKKLKQGTYKIRVRALIKSKGKTAYSNWTKTKKYKV